MSAAERHPLADLHLDATVAYSGNEFVVACSCGERFTGPTPDDAGAAQLEHVDAQLGDDAMGPYNATRALMAARRAAQGLRWDGTTTPGIEAVQDAISDLIWLAEIVDPDDAERIEASARFIVQDERQEAGL